MNTPLSGHAAERRAWLALLARATRAELDTGLAAAFGQTARPAFDWLRAPETGLAMVRARTGGTGDPFNAGEATVTRAVLRLKPDASKASNMASDRHAGTSGSEADKGDKGDNAEAASPAAPVGISYQLGRDKRRAELAALADALLQTPERRESLRAHLLVPVARRLEAQRQERHADAASTRVEFFTMVRGE
jgi:alpha-D-ribose 1-methylphosphonate 5-triphosphate synthase subunit PhnG